MFCYIFQHFTAAHASIILQKKSSNFAKD